MRKRPLASRVWLDHGHRRPQAGTVAGHRVEQVFAVVSRESGTRTCFPNVQVRRYAICSVTPDRVALNLPQSTDPTPQRLGLPPQASRPRRRGPGSEQPEAPVW